MLAAPTIARNLNPASQDYWRRTREARFGRTLEEFCPAGAEREKTFKGLEKDLGRITGNVQKNRDGGHFIMGAQPSFGDFALASIFVWARVMLNAEEYGRITAFDDGRWKAFMDSLEEYATVEDGEPYSAQRLAKV
jgi:glutathione S-transferase